MAVAILHVLTAIVIAVAVLVTVLMAGRFSNLNRARKRNSQYDGTAAVVRALL